MTPLSTVWTLDRAVAVKTAKTIMIIWTAETSSKTRMKASSRIILIRWISSNSQKNSINHFILLCREYPNLTIWNEEMFIWFMECGLFRIYSKSNLFHIQFLKIRDVDVCLVGLSFDFVLCWGIVFKISVVHTRCRLNARIAVVSAGRYWKL